MKGANFLIHCIDQCRLVTKMDNKNQRKQVLFDKVHQVMQEEGYVFTKYVVQLFCLCRDGCSTYLLTSKGMICCVCLSYKNANRFSVVNITS